MEQALWGQGKAKRRKGTFVVSLPRQAHRTQNRPTENQQQRVQKEEEKEGRGTDEATAHRHGRSQSRNRSRRQESKAKKERRVSAAAYTSTLKKENSNGTATSTTGRQRRRRKRGGKAARTAEQHSPAKTLADQSPGEEDLEKEATRAATTCCKQPSDLQLTRAALHAQRDG